MIATLGLACSVVALRPDALALALACAPGDPIAATAALEAALAGRSVGVKRFGKDRYGRTLAIVYADGASTSCSQIAKGHAVYLAKWEKGGMVAKECGL